MQFINTSYVGSARVRTNAYVSVLAIPVCLKLKDTTERLLGYTSNTSLVRKIENVV